jgi:adenine-specific DNA-methyltransferase
MISDFAEIEKLARRKLPMTSTRKQARPILNLDFMRPDGPGLYLHWDGRKAYRTKMPAPRVLDPVPNLSHGRDSENKIIEGDNLQAMVSLRSQYRGTIDIAYLDPPYNTGKNDFWYSDRRFRDPDAEANDGQYVTDEDGGRHTKWLNFIGPRLYLTWDLLADHGICFVSINDVELFRLGLLMDEVFGEHNRVGVVVWKQATDNNPTRIAVGHEYILCYAKNIDELPTSWKGHSDAKQWLLDTYERLKAKNPDPKRLEGKFRAAIQEHVRNYVNAIEKGQVTDLIDLGTLDRYWHVDKNGPYAANRNTDNPGKPGYFYDVVHPETKKVCAKPTNGYRFSPETMQQLISDNAIIYGKDHTQLVQLKKYLKDIHPPLRSVIERDARAGANILKKLFPKGAHQFKNPKPVELIQELIEYAGEKDCLVLDPFAGSGTTAHAVLRLNARDKGSRRFILIEEGTPQHPYCRTLTAPRIAAAIKQEKLDGGFQFLETGRRLNRTAILELEREAIANLIIQTDITGTGRGITRVSGKDVIGYNHRREAICLRWNGRNDSTITRDVLIEMFDEAKKRGLNKPLRVYGSTCQVGETESFRFCQIPDEILAALQIVEDEGSEGSTKTRGRESSNVR